MTVKNVINRVQQINEEVSRMVYCPQLKDYPPSIDTMNLPIALTDIESGEFSGRNNGQTNANESEDVYVVKVLFEALGQSDLGTKKEFGVEIYDAYRTKYLDPDTYKLQDPDGTWQQALMMILLDNPYRATIRQPFRTTGLTLIEHPLGSERWWHGFEMRFTVTEEWEWSCD